MKRLPVPRKALLVIIVVALALRVTYFRQIASESPFFERPIFDAYGYSEWAEEIAGGNLLWDEFRIHGPGYPYFLAVVSTITGGSLAAMTFVNVVLGVGWIVLLYLALIPTLPRPGPDIAAALCAVYWPFLHFEGHLLATTWFTFLLVLAFFLLTRASGRRSLFWIGAAGFALGLATITRPNAAAVALIVAAGLAWFAFRPGWPLHVPTVSPHRLAALALLVAWAVPVAPVLIRNHQLSGMWAVQHHTTFNLYLGNGPGSPGFAVVRPGRHWDRLSEAPARDGATTLAEHTAWFADRVRDRAWDDPMDFAALQIRKLRYFFHATEVRTTLAPEFFDRFAPLQTRLPGFGFVGPLAIVGLALAWPARRRFGLLAAFTIPSVALVVLTVIGSRYRIPTIPFLAAFAGLAGERFVTWVRERNGRALGAAAVGITAAAWVVNAPIPTIATTDFAEEMDRVAFVLREAGRFDEAGDWLVQALQENPSRAETFISFAELALDVGDVRRLNDVTAAGLRAAPGDADLLALRGKGHLLAGRPDSAVASLTIARETHADDADITADLARAHADAGHGSEAASLFLQVLPNAAGRVGILRDAGHVFAARAADSADPDERARWHAAATDAWGQAQELEASPEIAEALKALP